MRIDGGRLRRGRGAGRARARRSPGAGSPGAGSGSGRPSGVHDRRAGRSQPGARRRARCRSTSGSTAASTPTRCGSGSSPAAWHARPGRDHRPPRAATTPVRPRSLHAADLQPGLTTVEAVARWRVARRPRQPRRPHDDGTRPARTATTTTATGPDRARLEHVLVGARRSTSRPRDRCDVLAPTKCLMPFPNDFFTVPTTRRATGRRVHFDPAAMTANVDGVRDRPDRVEPQRRVQPRLDDRHLRRRASTSRAAARRRSPTSARRCAATSRSCCSTPTPASGGRSSPSSTRRPTRPTSARSIVRPGAQPDRGPPLRRRAARPARRERRADRGRSRLPAVPRPHPDVHARRSRPRRPHLERVFGDLDRAGIDRDDLFLAWDFTVASEREPRRPHAAHPRRRLRVARRRRPGVHGRRRSRTNVDDRIYRRVTGTFTVPSYLTGDGSPGNQFAYAPGAGPDALPVRNGDVTAGFICNIPRSATADGNDPVTRPRRRLRPRPARQQRRGQRGQRAHDVRTSTTSSSARPKWAGFSEDDIGIAVATLAGPLELPEDRRPHAAGLPQLPVPRPADQGPATASRPTPRSRPAPRTRRCSTARSSTTATARAASSAARSPRCRPSGRARCSACRA